MKYATFFPGGFYSSSFGFFMNEDKWNKLSKQDQDAIMSVSGEALARLAGKSWDAADRGGLEAMKAAGVQIIDASPAFVADVRQRTAAAGRRTGSSPPARRASTAPRPGPSTRTSSRRSPPAK